MLEQRAVTYLSGCWCGVKKIYGDVVCIKVNEGLLPEVVKQMSVRLKLTLDVCRLFISENTACMELKELAVCTCPFPLPETVQCGGQAE